MKKLSVLLMASLLLGVASIAHADDAPDWTMTGDLGPQAESPIVMQKEVVRFDIPLTPSDSIPASATFWFNNPTGKEVTVPSFFPTVRQSQVMYGTSESDAGFLLPYAKNVQVAVDGTAVSSTVRIGTFPIRDDKQALISFSAAGVAFPFTVPAHGTAVVKISFDSPSEGGNDIFYYLGSGSGWAGSIGDARFEIHYPVPHQPESVHLFSESGAWNGDIFTADLKQFEPTGMQSIGFQFFWPEKTQQLTKIRQRIAASPKDPVAWMELADFLNPRGCLWQIGCGPFLNTYWSALDTSLELRYGKPLSAPKNLDDARAIADAIMYAPARVSDASDIPPGILYADQARMIQIQLYVQLMTYIAAHSWPTKDHAMLLAILKKDYVMRYRTVNGEGYAATDAFTEKEVTAAQTAYLKNGGTQAELDSAVAAENPNLQPTQEEVTPAEPATTGSIIATPTTETPTQSTKTLTYLLSLAVLLAVVGLILNKKI